MTANKACVDSHGFDEGILRAFDGVFHLRSAGTARHSDTHFKSNRSHFRKKNDAKTIDKLQSDGIQIFTGICHTIINCALQRFGIQFFHAITGQVFGDRLNDVVRCICAGDQAVDGISINGALPTLELTGDQISRVSENAADVPVCQWSGIHGLVHSITSDG